MMNFWTGSALEEILAEPASLPPAVRLRPYNSKTSPVPSAEAVSPSPAAAIPGHDSRITLPDLWCPFPTAIHKDADHIEEGTIAWMRRFGYTATAAQEVTARRSQFGMHAARVHPSGRRDAVQLASDLTVWLFLTDDVYIEAPGNANELSVIVDHAIQAIRILRDPDDLPRVPNASLLALQDVSRRLAPMATDEQVDRLVGGMVEFFLAGCCEAVCFSRKSLPTVENYLPVRDAINCLRAVCFVFIEIVGGFALPGSIWCRPDLQALVRKATRIVGNHHDLLSGVRELSHEVPMNLPAVIAHEQQLPLTEAFVRVAEMANADTRELIQMADRLLAEAPGNGVRAYVNGLKAWIRGNLDWSRTTGRYRVKDYA